MRARGHRRLRSGARVTCQVNRAAAAGRSPGKGEGAADPSASPAPLRLAWGGSPASTLPPQSQTKQGGRLRANTLRSAEVRIVGRQLNSSVSPSLVRGTTPLRHI